ncbi:MAG: lipid A-modifier LpxR family protein [Paracoccaceae bacterium]
MHRLLAAFVCACLALLAARPAATEEYRRIGYGRLVTNDQFGDVKDRDRTGAYTASHIFGAGWDGRLPTRPGDLFELRFHAETMTPRYMQVIAPGDRPYAGSLSLGLHTHFRHGATEVSLGGDVVVTGPQTGLDDLQLLVHGVLGGAKASRAVRDNQIPDGVHPTLVTEIAHPVRLGANTRLRPFLEGRAGAETMLRAGADLTIGQVGAGELLIRESSSGHRYRAIKAAPQGYSVVLGGDIARVKESVFLPAARGYELTDRKRLRAGVHWQGRRHAVFYGLTWLDREFERQEGGQVIGSLRLDIRF